MAKNKFITTPQQDGEALVLGLNMLFTSGSRAFAVARTWTVGTITSAQLRTEMLEAIDLLEKHFTLKQSPSRASSA